MKRVAVNSSGKPEEWGETHMQWLTNELPLHWADPMDRFCSSPSLHLDTTVHAVCEKKANDNVENIFFATTKKLIFFVHDKLCLSYINDAKSQQSRDSRQVF